jgi:hypothetical protein
MQEMMEMQEILARIAAIERGEDPFAASSKGVVVRDGMWSAAVRASVKSNSSMGARDWLHSVCMRRTRGVVLRY